MKNIYNKGFTLIESLVSITILMIAIAGPLTIANKAYTSAMDARNQMVATYLAQEGLEYVNSMKDNLLWGPWISGLVAPALFAQCSANCLDTSTNPPPAPLNNIPSPPSEFTRTYVLEYDPSYPDQVFATVSVSWKTGTISSSVYVQQVLSRQRR